MEQGSLLEEALAAQSRLRKKQFSSPGGTGLSSGTLWLDVFIVSDNDEDSTSAGTSNNKELSSSNSHQPPHDASVLVNLAKIANELNQYIVERTSNDCMHMMWHYGGDGPTFGICYTSGIPHLRGEVKYGYSANVTDDCRRAIQLLTECCCSTSSLVEILNQPTKPLSLAISCWDMSPQDDGSGGPYLLIEFANALPDWIDEDLVDEDGMELDDANDDQSSNLQKSLQEHERDRYTSWIVCDNRKGNPKMQLLKQNPSLSQALQLLKRECFSHLSSEGGGGVSIVDENEGLQNAFTSYLNNSKEEGDSTSDKESTNDFTVMKRTPILLPRVLVLLLEKNPSLIHTAIQSYSEYQRLRQQYFDMETPVQQKQSCFEKLDLSNYEDWVWTVQRISKTNLAMLRTIPACDDDHRQTLNDDPAAGQEDNSINKYAGFSIPSNFKVNVEVKRSQRKFGGGSDSVPATTMTPHLQNSIGYGIRIVAGIQYMIEYKQQLQEVQGSSSSLGDIGVNFEGTVLNYDTLYGIPPKSPSERIGNWIQLLQASATAINTPKLEEPFSPPAIIDWLETNYRRGPNSDAISAQSRNDFESILNCPVWQIERKFLFHRHRGGASLVNGLILHEWKQYGSRTDGEENDTYPVPTSKDIDDEIWLEDLLTSKQDGQSNDEGSNDKLLDTMVSKFQNFMVQESSGDHQGIIESQPASSSTNVNNTIRPRVVLNLLYTILKGNREEIVFPAKEKGSEEWNELMAAMDDELSSKAPSRTLDTVENNENEDEESHVLVNLLKSLEASSSGSNMQPMPSPVTSMMTEMGIAIPHV